jgi:hypothetical protein
MGGNLMNVVTKITGRELTGYELANIRNAYSRQRNIEIDRRISIKPKVRKLHKDYRASLIETVVVTLKEGKPTHFALEGTCRHSVRSLLCVEGWGWNEADTASADIVRTALGRIGATRPSWWQGQREYRGEEFHGTLRRCINPRCRCLLEEDQRLYCSEHCGQAVRQKRYEETNKERVAAQKRVWATRQMEADPEGRRQRLREIRARYIARCETRDCAHCGKQFNMEHSSKSNRFCSIECYHNYGRINETRSCDKCGANFFVRKKSDTKRFCSRECGYSRNDVRKERSCVVCFGRFYVPYKSSVVRTCSRKCGAALRRYGPTPVPQTNKFNCEAVTPESDAA